MTLGDAPLQSEEAGNQQLHHALIWLPGAPRSLTTGPAPGGPAGEGAYSCAGGFREQTRELTSS